MEKLYLTEWRSRVEVAKIHGAFSMEDWMDAQDWETCAVGEGIAITRDMGIVGGDDLDWTDLPKGIVDLGNSLSAAVNHDDIEAAAALLPRIEDRFNAWLKRQAAE